MQTISMYLKRYSVPYRDPQSAFFSRDLIVIADLDGK